jgi:hypothetical protein
MVQDFSTCWTLDRHYTLIVNWRRGQLITSGIVAPSFIYFRGSSTIAGMIIPQFWAEGRVQHRERNRQVTVRRFGWSDESQSAAQAHADARAREALAKVLSGETLERREPKMPYNGAEGVPIREEIVSRHRGSVITRNSYGAKCLNTPNVFFADIDFEEPFSLRGCVATVAIVLLGAGLTFAFASTWQTAILGALAVLILGPLVLSYVRRAVRRLRGGDEQIALARVRRFFENHPSWYARLYRTPAGLRVLALHKTFDPNAPEVAEAFQELGVDPIYARMCLRQQCFRARVSPKPWRMGISDRLRPRPGVWPVAPDRLPMRNAWLQNYDARSIEYASCAFIDALGSGTVHPEARFIQELHDELCQATRPLPLA